MSKKNAERNSLIINLFKEGRSINEILNVLDEMGYSKLSRQGVFAVWRRSLEFIPKRVIHKYCNFCLRERLVNETVNFSLKGRGYKICKFCIDRLLPKK